MAAKKKARIFVVSHSGYPFDVMVAIGVSDEELTAALKRTRVIVTDDERESMRGVFVGRTVMLDDGPTVLLLKAWRGTPKHHSHLAHEIFHCVDMLMWRVGVRLSKKSDEAYAYAIEGLTQSILEKIEG